MKTANLLVEIFVEELPPKALQALGEAFAARIYGALNDQGLINADAVCSGDKALSGAPSYEVFASPRRLATLVRAVRTQAPDMQRQVKLMPVDVGIDAAGKATSALLKKLQALGADASAVGGLRRAMDGKAEVLFFDSTVKGASLAEGLQQALAETVAKLPIPKVMTYQLADGWSDVKFVRPAHSLIALHGNAVVPVQALGLQAGNTTRGHRFEAAIDPIVLTNADDYAVTLEKDGAVIASFDGRRAEIARQLAAAASLAGGASGALLHVAENKDLLDEVTGLVERPNVLVCRFEKEFLDVPQECLILTMQANQKYFPLLDTNGKLTNQFLVVSNIHPDDPGAVISGNERVIRPRLADAKFFFDQDRSKKLESHVPALARVTYHNKLGNQYERTLRVQAIAQWVAERIGADVGLAGRAAYLAKADLLTEMVGEFPELQGIMGGHYAAHQGEHQRVIEAIRDQYLLLKQDDAPLSNLVSDSLAIADRAETLIGIWGIGLKPTGEKDPYALRRQALILINRFQMLGRVAMLFDDKVTLHLSELLRYVSTTFPAGLLSQQTQEEVTVFIYERFHNRLVGADGVRNDLVDAVLSQRPPLHEVAMRIKAVAVFAALPEAPALAAANKRIGNILKKAEKADAHVSELLLKEPAEHALFAAMNDVTPQADAQFDAGNYTASLQTLAALRAPVDAFFENVMVNAEQADLRLNRLGLLATLHRAMNRVADLSRLAA